MDEFETENIREAFATVLRRKRHALGISQEELAGRAGISMRFVSLLECNKRQPTLSILWQLSRAFDTSLSEFTGDIEAIAK
jgi:transcriptional regulator with XRE-family HTH domain